MNMFHPGAEHDIKKAIPTLKGLKEVTFNLSTGKWKYTYCA
jgi:hypothetical protein